MKEARFSSIKTIDRTLIRCYHSGTEWTWEQWQWRDTPHSPKLQYYWSFTIILFSVISRSLIGWGFTSLQRYIRCILQLQPTGQVCWVKKTSWIQRPVKKVIVFHYHKWIHWKSYYCEHYSLLSTTEIQFSLFIDWKISKKFVYVFNKNPQILFFFFKLAVFSSFVNKIFSFMTWRKM